jgi:hypothetical protein
VESLNGSQKAPRARETEDWDNTQEPGEIDEAQTTLTRPGASSALEIR